jgi:hypothetical protein
MGPGTGIDLAITATAVTDLSSREQADPLADAPLQLSGRRRSRSLLCRMLAAGRLGGAKMTSLPVRDSLDDQLLTPQNVALVLIDYQDAQINSIPTYDRTSINPWEDADFVSAVRATGRKKLIMGSLWTEVCLALPYWTQ